MHAHPTHYEAVKSKIAWSKLERINVLLHRRTSASKLVNDANESIRLTAQLTVKHCDEEIQNLKGKVQ